MAVVSGRRWGGNGLTDAYTTLPEGFNLLETLFPAVELSASGRGPKTFLEVLEESQAHAAAVLRRAEQTLDQSLLRRAREVRGHIAAHIDEKQTLATSLAELSGFPIGEFDALLKRALDAFNEACACVPILSRLLSIEGQQLRGVIRVEPTNGLVPFDA